jgi:hypothetical protein
MVGSVWRAELDAMGGKADHFGSASQQRGELLG